MTENEERDVQQTIGLLLNEKIREFGNKIIVVSGGAKGVDTIAKETAEGLGLKVETHKPDVDQWKDFDDKKGYKSRNIEIAKNCDSLICIITTSRKEFCHHHKTEDHDRSGACFTERKAHSFGKETIVIPLFSRY